MTDVQQVYTVQIESPIGPLRLASTDEGLLYVELPHASGRGMAGFLRQRMRGAVVHDGYAPNQAAVKQVIEYLEGKRKTFELPLDLRGTPFQLEVWDALRRIPYGETRSYADVARELGRDTATRAVGTANGANPISLVVPCHRVINSDGRLGGYAGGLEVKARLLAMEQGRALDKGRLL
jgi:O-6-methylguanine DNA methyltransferase